MVQIHGQIDSLKRLKNELRSYGIHRFNSIKEINDFLKNFNLEKETIINNQREILKNDIKSLNQAIKENQEKSEIIKNKTITEIEVNIDSIRINIDILKQRIDKSFLHKFFLSYSLKRQQKLLEYYNSNSQVIILNAIRNVQEIIKKDEDKLRDFTINNELIITTRSSPEIQKLNYVKNTIESLHSLIAGAVGENLVVKEIEKLPDDYILINDFNLKFNPPIHNRNTNDKIFSVQIDHLLISKSGIYILETKNWSKRSVESLDLRSPVEQITRTSYALFLFVNDAKIRLTEHHWGEKKIPIKNIIVMINEKPKEDFKYVKVLSVNELCKYITYFEPIFTETEVDRIAKYLIGIQN